MKFDLKDLTYIVSQKLPQKRMIHSLAVVHTAKKLAKIYAADIEKVMVASLLHDVCKYTNMTFMQGICKKYYGHILSAEDLKNNEILHGFMAVYWLEKKLNIRDEEILNAIKYHTIGAENMSLISKIVYIADAIEPNRTYPGVDKLRELAPKDLELCILTEIEAKEKYLKSINKTPHKNTLLMKESLLKGRKK